MMHYSCSSTEQLICSGAFETSDNLHEPLIELQQGDQETCRTHQSHHSLMTTVLDDASSFGSFEQHM